MKKVFQTQAFSILELMVTVVVIAVVAAGATVSMRHAASRGINMEAQNLLYAIFTAQQDYRRENGAFTNDINDLDITISDIKNFRIQALSTGTNVGSCVTNGIAVLQSNTSNPTYELWIDDNGAISCTTSGTCDPDFCSKIGFR